MNSGYFFSLFPIRIIINRREIAKNKDFIPNLKYPCLFYEDKEQKNILVIFYSKNYLKKIQSSRKLIDIKSTLEKHQKSDNKTEFSKWKTVFFLNFEIKIS